MRPEIYREAYEEAHREQDEILGRLEQLRQKREGLERLVEALGSLLSDSGAPASAGVSQPEPEAAELVVATTAVAVTPPEIPAPFNRRAEGTNGRHSGGRNGRGR